MALCRPDNEPNVQQQHEPKDRVYWDPISTWIDDVILSEPADMQANTSQADWPGRGGFAPKHRLLLPTETQTRFAGVVAPSYHPTMLAYCYRVLDNGAVAVAEGHPWACACSWNEHLHAKDSNYTPPLAAYAASRDPMPLLDMRQRYLNIIMCSCTDISYPFEKFGVMSYNPFQQAERRDSLTHTPLALEPILAVGEAINGETAMQKIIGNAWGTINGAFDLAAISESSAVEKQLIMHALVCITTVPFVMGDLAAWHAQFQNLRQFIDATGILACIAPHEVAKARMVDLDGAVFAGVAPSLPYSRKYQLLPCCLPAEDVEWIVATLRPRLQACGIGSDAADTIIAVCIFIWTIQLSSRHGLEKFDPDNLMEDYEFLQRDLLASPEPLRHFSTSDVFLARTSAIGNSPTPDVNGRYAMEESFPFFEEALRVTTLMCLRAASMQAPLSKRVFTALLALLVDRLQIILDCMSTRRDDGVYIDPALIYGDEENKALRTSSAVPFLIWMCVLGYQLSVYYAVYHQGWSDHHPEGCVFVRLLNAIGIRDKEDADAVRDEDLLVLETLNLNWATENKWHPRDMLRWVVG